MVHRESYGTFELASTNSSKTGSRWRLSSSRLLCTTVVRCRSLVGVGSRHVVRRSRRRRGRRCACLVPAFSSCRHSPPSTASYKGQSRAAAPAEALTVLKARCCTSPKGHLIHHSACCYSMPPPQPIPPAKTHAHAPFPSEAKSSFNVTQSHPLQTTYIIWQKATLS